MIALQPPRDLSLSPVRYSVKRLGDGTFFDFADGTFKASPARPTAPLTEAACIPAERPVHGVLCGRAW